MEALCVLHVSLGSDAMMHGFKCVEVWWRGCHSCALFMQCWSMDWNMAVNRRGFCSIWSEVGSLERPLGSPLARRVIVVDCCCWNVLPSSHRGTLLQ